MQVPVVKVHSAGEGVGVVAAVFVTIVHCLGLHVYCPYAALDESSVVEMKKELDPISEQSLEMSADNCKGTKMNRVIRRTLIFNVNTASHVAVIAKSKKSRPF